AESCSRGVLGPFRELYSDDALRAPREAARADRRLEEREPARPHPAIVPAPSDLRLENLAVAPPRDAPGIPLVDHSRDAVALEHDRVLVPAVLPVVPLSRIERGVLFAGGIRAP